MRSSGFLGFIDYRSPPGGAVAVADPSRFDRLNVEHFVGGPEARSFVEAAALFRGVQRNDADAAAAGFGEC